MGIEECIVKLFAEQAELEERIRKLETYISLIAGIPDCVEDNNLGLSLEIKEVGQCSE